MGGRRPTFPQVDAVSSALPGLTSLFGMGRGAPRRHSRHLSLSDSRLFGRGKTGKQFRTDIRDPEVSSSQIPNSQFHLAGARTPVPAASATGPARVFPAVSGGTRKLSGN